MAWCPLQSCSSCRAVQCRMPPRQLQVCLAGKLPGSQLGGWLLETQQFVSSSPCLERVRILAVGWHSQKSPCQLVRLMMGGGVVLGVGGEAPGEGEAQQVSLEGQWVELEGGVLSCSLPAGWIQWVPDGQEVPRGDAFSSGTIPLDMVDPTASGCPRKSSSPVRASVTGSLVPGDCQAVGCPQRGYQAVMGCPQLGCLPLSQRLTVPVRAWVCGAACPECLKVRNSQSAPCTHRHNSHPSLCLSAF